MNIDALTSAGLLNRQLVLLGRQQLTGRAHGSGARRPESHGLVVGQGIQEFFIAHDESLLILFVELARDNASICLPERSSPE